MESKMVSTEHQKARREPEVCDLPTKPKNDMSPTLQEKFSVANFVYKSSCL